MKQSLSKTKIVATIGPASSSKEILKKMITEGVDVFRINFSHSKKEEFLELSNKIKELNNECSSHVSILADLQGPKLRVGEIENNLLDLVSGDIATFVPKNASVTKIGFT